MVRKEVCRVKGVGFWVEGGRWLVVDRGGMDGKVARIVNSGCESQLARLLSDLGRGVVTGFSKVVLQVMNGWLGCREGGQLVEVAAYFFDQLMDNGVVEFIYGRLRVMGSCAEMMNTRNNSHGKNTQANGVSSRQEEPTKNDAHPSLSAQSLCRRLQL
ncbi:hypothetical protein NE237_003369 [Protea cynaroides]|uniref:Uncharacterized protein n=1 Tax=Protea cynaroides TaxID=273540 RepID=A0A9Q0QSD1_9MAGN|nr:hypothetical protein NE237_003369 [Protea cynaroides]